MRALSILALIVGLALAAPASAAEGAKEATLYKNPQCTCCEAYADYLRENGFDVTVVPTHDLSLIKQRHGVPAAYEGCHTMLIDGYVVEGHVPVDILDRLLTERPDLKGISLPGMPMGSPGMSGEKTEPFTIFGFGDEPTEVYAVE
jgi:hypothetical protein